MEPDWLLVVYQHRKCAVVQLLCCLALHHKPPFVTWFPTLVLCEFQAAGQNHPEMPGGALTSKSYVPYALRNLR